MEDVPLGTMKMNMKTLSALIEVKSVFILTLVQIWIFGNKNLTPALIALGIVMAGWILRKEGPEKIGLLNWQMSVIFVLLFVWRESGFGTNLPDGYIFLADALRYYSWAIFQQLILNGFFSLRLREICRDDETTALWAGTIFALLHIPNPLLMVVTFAGGTVASYLFLKMKRKNIYLLALAHVSLGIAIKNFLPYFLHKNLVVGPRFFGK